MDDVMMINTGAVGLMAVFVMVTALLSFRSHDADSNDEIFNEQLQKDFKRI